MSEPRSYPDTADYAELLATCKAIDAHCRAENPKTLGNQVAHTEEGKELRERMTKAITACESCTGAHAQPCTTCGGRGEIGGFVSADSGYQTDRCPDCERANWLLADAHRIIAEYKAGTIAGAKADVAAHGLPGARGRGEPDLAAENKKLIDALRTIVSEYGPDHGSRYCFRIAVDVLKDVAAGRTSQLSSTERS